MPRVDGFEKTVADQPELGDRSGGGRCPLLGVERPGQLGHGSLEDLLQLTSGIGGALSDAPTDPIVHLG